MSLEELAKSVDKKTDRVRFLKKGSLLTLTAVAGALGFPGNAKALYSYKCCDLCQPPSSSCTGPCDWWSWTCCWFGAYPAQKWTCIECYHGGGCATACSQANYLGVCAEGPE